MPFFFFFFFLNKHVTDNSNSQINKPYLEHVFPQFLYDNLIMIKKGKTTLKAGKSPIQTEHHFWLEK